MSRDDKTDLEAVYWPGIMESTDREPMKLRSALREGEEWPGHSLLFLRRLYKFAEGTQIGSVHVGFRQPEEWTRSSVNLQACALIMQKLNTCFIQNSESL